MLTNMKYRYCVYELTYRSYEPHVFLSSFDNESQATEYAGDCDRRICIDSETMEVCT